MLRSLLFVIGIFLLIAGAQTLAVDKWIMSYELPSGQATSDSRSYYSSNSNNSPFRTAGYTSRYGNSSYGSQFGQSTPATSTIKPVYQTRDWMPWSLLAGGTIIVLYTYSMGRRSE